MKFLPGPAFTAASGSIGGTVFSHNRYGVYTRSRTIPTNPNTAAQQAARNRLANYSAAFASLSAAVQLQWKSWAQSNPIVDALGQSQILSGHAAYVKLNSRLDAYGQSPITSPPITTAPTGLLTATLTADIGAGSFQVAYTATPLAANTHLIVYGCLVSSTAIKYVRNLWRFVQAGAAAGASPLDIETNFAAVFGTPQVGQIARVRCFVLSDVTGLISGAIDAQATVTTT